MRKLAPFLSLFMAITASIYSMEEGAPKRHKSEQPSSSQSNKEVSDNNNNNAEVSASSKASIIDAVKSGKHERLTDLLSPFAKGKPTEIVQLLRKEGFSTQQLIVEFANYRLERLLADHLKDNQISKQANEILQQAHIQNHTQIDESPEICFSNSIPHELQSFITDSVKNNQLLSKKYLYVKLFSEKPVSIKSNGTAAIYLFFNSGDLHLNLEIHKDPVVNKGVVLHELAHAVRGHAWLIELLRREHKLNLSKELSHHIEREADLLAACGGLDSCSNVQKALESLKTGSDTHPAVETRFKDIRYLKMLIEAEEKLKK
ncbi:hypothetical protein HYX58_02750 [Candidatus Dependentiae bacterium]|nr:hypothetical protein [Candidatus Dependentiae bacterium]